MNSNGFCQQIALMEQEMSTWDRFKSRPVYLLLREILVFVIFLFLFGISDSLAKDGIIGEQQFTLFFAFVLLPLPLYLAVRFFRDFHLNNPRRKIFFSKRLAALAGMVLEKDASIEFYSAKRKPVEFSSSLPVLGPFKAKYTMDLMANQGGIILGGPAKLPGKMKDTTFYWLLSCETVLPDMNVSFNNRGGALEKLSMNKIQANPDFAKEEFLSELKTVMKKTILKGELRILKKQLYLYLYDNVKSIHPLSGDPLFNHNASKKSKAENRAFENIFDLLHLFSKGTLPQKEAL